MRSTSSPSHSPTLYLRRRERKENPMQHRPATIVSALLLGLALASPTIAQGNSAGPAIRGSGAPNTIATTKPGYCIQPGYDPIRAPR